MFKVQSYGSSVPCTNFFAVRQKDNSKVLGEGRRTESAL